MKEGKNYIICGDETEFEGYLNDSTINVLSYDISIAPTDPGYPDLFRAVVVFEDIFKTKNSALSIVLNKLESIVASPHSFDNNIVLAKDALEEIKLLTTK